MNSLLQRGVAAGASLLRPAQEADWGGCSVYFADPDGHAWEIASNPHCTIDAAGDVVMN